jgi:phosphohistidine phosphatase SixA
MLLYLIRHAQPDMKTGVPYQTRPGPPLSDEGQEQAAAIARLLEHSHIERVVSSPMRRSVMTAEPLCARLGLDLVVDDDLGEIQSGEDANAVGLRMFRAVLSQLDVSVVALVSHAAPLEHMLLALTHGTVMLPRAGDGGARLGMAHVWQVWRRDGAWYAHHLPEGGIRA